MQENSTANCKENAFPMPGFREVRMMMEVLFFFLLLTLKELIINGVCLIYFHFINSQWRGLNATWRNEMKVAISSIVKKARLKLETVRTGSLLCSWCIWDSQLAPLLIHFTQLDLNWLLLTKAKIGASRIHSLVADIPWLSEQSLFYSSCVI